jgi:hypothetical protein
MAGGKVVTIETRGKYELCCYGSPGFPGWAVFIEGKSVINGSWSDVWKKYVDLIATQR